MGKTKGKRRNFAIQIQDWFCRNMEGFMWKVLRLLHEIHKPLTFCEMRANFMRGKLGAAKSKFVGRSRSALSKEI